MGAGSGVVADRIAARWPAHDDGSVRSVDWRTLVVIVLGALAMVALAGRFSAAPQLGLFGAYFLVLTLLLATDLDQRLLPDVITLPLVPICLLVDLAGVNPLVHVGDLPGAIGVAVVLPILLYVLSVPFGAGAIGIGDLKLLISVGLLSGLPRAILGAVTGALLSGVVVLVLLATRRVTLRSFIPFGPFLIVGAFWAVLVKT